VDLKEKGISRGELRAVAASLGGIEALIDRESKEKDLLALLDYLVPEQAEEKILENPTVLRQPIVRNGRLATVGCAPEIWKTWE
jgi:arsenate reductase-like glutaredoxin family protein